MEKSRPEKEDHPHSKFIFSEGLFEKNVDSFVWAKGARACSDCNALAKLTLLARGSLYSSCERFGTSCKEMKEKLALQG